MAEAKEQPQPHTEYVAHIETDRTKTGTDDALQYLNEHERVTWEPDEEKAVKKKIDMVVLPLVRNHSTLSRRHWTQLCSI